MWLCEECGEAVKAEPSCFVCGCGLSFFIEVTEDVVDGVAVVRCDVGLPLPGTTPVILSYRDDRIVA